MSKAFDGRHLYILDQQMGLQKFDVSSSGLGRLVAINATFALDGEAALMLLNDKLYLRIQTSDGKLFKIVEKDTLESIPNDSPYEAEEGVKQNLLYLESMLDGRSLGYTPLITHQNFVYVISRRDAGEYDDEDHLVP